MNRFSTVAATGVALVTLLSGRADAQVRTGSTLQVDAEVTDGAGGEVTSASYSMVTAASQTQVGEAQSANWTLEIGFLPGDPANTPPVLADIPTPQSAPEHFTFTIQLGATDPDAPPQLLTYGMTGAPANATLDPGTGLFSFRPDESQGGTSYPVEFTVDDGEEGVDSQEVTIQVVESDTGEGDVNQDGEVDEFDIAIIALYFALDSTAYENADQDGSGIIGGGDFARVIANWGNVYM